MLIAITRPPTEALARCELTLLERQPIDIDRAIAQHRAYERLLATLGARVVSLSPAPDLPDSAFVEDIAVVLDDVAVLTRPGAASRRGEIAGVAEALSAYRPVVALEPPATLDGGDVLRVDNLLLIGASGRTNAEGIRQLGAIARRHGCQTRPVPVDQRCLHLKSACSHLGQGALLANLALIDRDALSDFELVPVPPGEPGAANTFFVGDRLVISKGCPKTQAVLTSRGIAVETVDISELKKAEAAGSCLSLVFEEREYGG